MRRFALAILAVCLVTQSVTAATKYNLTSNERAVITTWFYEPFGYLDACVDNAGTSARDALTINPALDLTLWILTGTKGASTAQSDWNDCAMFWWILVNDNVTVTIQPLQSQAWEAVLVVYNDSIASAFARASLLQRNAGCTIQMYGTDGQPSGTLPCGTHLQTQTNFFSKVIDVLQ